MGKIVRTLLAVIMACILLPHLVLPVQAVGEKEQFLFELSVDGRDTKEEKNGDIITVVLRLKRTDKAEDYTMYAMQDEIRYDSQFFELVDESAVLSDGIVSTDIARVDQFREFYMNYLSMSGGEKWKADTLIGSFQLKVIGTSGVSTISNQDYLVSMKDGSDSYPCDAKDVTIILSTECVISFQTSGGSDVAEVKVQFGEKLTRPEDPVREGYSFEGWYKDIHLTEKWDFEQETVQGNMSLYAKWKEIIVEEDIENVPDATENEEGVGTNDVATGDTNEGIGNYGYIIILIIPILLILLYLRRKKTRLSDN